MSGGFYRDNTTGDPHGEGHKHISTVRQATGMGFVALVDGVFHDRP
jgi:hypothetical protein